jgi:hypothetical protein
MLRACPRNLDALQNRFNVRTIFKTEHTLCGTLMETGPVTDAQKMTQRVHNIPCDCGRGYIGATNRPLEVRIEHQYNLTPSKLEKSKLEPNICTMKATKYVGTKRTSYRLNQTPLTGVTRNISTCLCRSSDQ